MAETLVSDVEAVAVRAPVDTTTRAATARARSSPKRLRVRTTACALAFIPRRYPKPPGTDLFGSPLRRTRTPEPVSPPPLRSDRTTAGDRPRRRAWRRPR